ncbi:MAG: segregation/condensation protein A [Clostridia bacterium]|nr:segregation/condensation protein A [Clostridia bacterium]
MAYKVKLDIFEGPFDLLVYLIEHAKMSIYDIKVSEITTQYLATIAEMKAHDVAVTQEFMVLAAELIELKSRMLLPRSEDGEEEEEEDPRSGLVARLLEYKQYKEMAAFLEEQAEATAHSHAKPQEDLTAYVGEAEELLKTDMNAFVKAFYAFLFRKQRLDEMRRVYERVERQRMSVETRITQIRELFHGRKKLMFSEMIKEDSSPYNQVITFMSLLELIKQKDVEATQKKRFGDIAVRLIEEKPEEPAAPAEERSLS